MKTPGPHRWLATSLGLLLSGWVALAQPVVSSVVPGRGETGVAPSATIRFTFSEAMDPTATQATIMAIHGTGFEYVVATPAWSAGNTILTYTPVVSLSGGSMVYWDLIGMSSLGIDMDSDSGYFYVSGGSIGCDPAVPMMSFTVSKGWMYYQLSAGLPELHTSSPFCFLACMTIPCPRDATNVTIRTPLMSTSSLSATANPGHPNLLDCSASTPGALDAVYGSGDYLFTVKAATSNQAVTVNFPATLTQPPAPHVSNWTLGQAIDPTKPFTLMWDPMSGGSAADCIYVEVYGDVFKTPTLGEPGALNGTATSVVIPANRFQPNQTYSGSITFYHYQLLTNASSHISLAYRASVTEFDLNTTSGSDSALVITNAAVVRATGKFVFDVECLPGQTILIERSPSLVAGSWPTIYATNATTSVVRITDNLAPANENRFYRARKGP